MRTEHCQEEEGKLVDKNTTSEHVLISRLELKKADYFACADKEKLMTDIDTDKLALISDCPFLKCVFRFLPMKCYLYDSQEQL